MYLDHVHSSLIHSNFFQEPLPHIIPNFPMLHLFIFKLYILFYIIIINLEIVITSCSLCLFSPKPFHIFLLALSNL